MNETIFLSFVIAMPVIIEIFILYNNDRRELLKKSLRFVLNKRYNKCEKFLFTTCPHDNYPYLRRILNPIEEFNLNMLFLMSIFIDLLLTENTRLRIIVAPFLIGLLMTNRQMSLKACKGCHRIVESKKHNKIFKFFYNKSVLLYAVIILCITFSINLSILYLFD